MELLFDPIADAGLLKFKVPLVVAAAGYIY